MYAYYYKINKNKIYYYYIKPISAGYAAFEMFSNMHRCKQSVQSMVFTSH